MPRVFVSITNTKLICYQMTAFLCCVMLVVCGWNHKKHLRASIIFTFLYGNLSLFASFAMLMRPKKAETAANKI